MKTGFEGKIWSTGNSYVVTIPPTIIEKYKLTLGKVLVFFVTDEGCLELKFIKRSKE
jgi:antitoxin component of MazEF toxin-antitoxin module